jgi:hypothetical protein
MRVEKNSEPEQFITEEKESHMCQNEMGVTQDEWKTNSFNGFKF